MSTSDRIDHYQLLKTFSHQWNDSISSIYLPDMIFATGAMQAFSIYSTIRLFGKVDLLKYLISPIVMIDAGIIVTGTTYLAAMMEKESKRQISDMRTRKRKCGFYRRKMKCLKPFGIKTTFFPFIKKIYLLNYFYLESNLALTLLVEDSK